MSIRSLAFLINPSRPEAIKAAGELAPLLFSAGFSLYTISDVSIEGIKKVATTNRKGHQDVPVENVVIERATRD